MFFDKSKPTKIVEGVLKTNDLVHRTSGEEDWLVVKPSDDSDKKEVQLDKKPSSFDGDDVLVQKNDGSDLKNIELAKEKEPHPEQSQEKILVDNEPLLSKEHLEALLAKYANKKTVVDSYYLVKKNLRVLVVIFLMGVLVHQASCKAPSVRGGVERSSKNNSTTRRTEDTAGRSFSEDNHQESTPARSGSSKATMEELSLLRRQIQQLQVANQQYSSDLSRLSTELSHCRAEALVCDQDLQQVSSSYVSLAESLEKTKKSLAPVAFIATSVAPPAQSGAFQNHTSPAAVIRSPSLIRPPMPPTSAPKIPSKTAMAVAASTAIMVG